MSTAGTGRAKTGSHYPAGEYQARRFAGAPELTPKRAGYGLPCANCGTYYAADQSSCPICKCPERVSPDVALPAAAAPSVESSPDITQLDEERERFLREYKAQLFAVHTQIDAAASFGCTLSQTHGENYEPASVCKECYEHVQRKADLLEAALHMDLKEAAQVVHDAVWADTSDPTKTYQNAAQALLTELRRRAGIDMVLTTLNPYTH